jgi:hypothetical protein
MLNPTCTVFTCMSLFTKHNYRAKKFNYLTLRGKSNVNGLYVIVIFVPVLFVHRLYVML